MMARDKGEKKKQARVKMVRNDRANFIKRKWGEGKKGGKPSYICCDVGNERKARKSVRKASVAVYKDLRSVNITLSSNADKKNFLLE